MAEKATDMVLKVDLQCPYCYKKVKKILCKFPEIRDRVFDEKSNTVTITVICCSPEKIRDKLFCKGYPAIKSIEIKEPKPKPKPEPDPPKEKPKTPPPKCTVPAMPRTCCWECYEGNIGGPCYHGYGWKPPLFSGPCYHGYGVPPPVQPYCGCHGHGCRNCHVIRCDYLICEENPQPCSIM